VVLVQTGGAKGKLTGKLVTNLFRNQLSRLLTCVLLLTAFTTGSNVEAASAVSVGVCWAWNMENKTTGNFLTNGSYNGASANAGTYTLIDFKVNTSIYPSVEVGSISDGTYAFGGQPPYSFIWSGSAPTTFQRNGYTNGFGIGNGTGVPNGAYFVFDINYSSVSDSVYGTSRFSSSNTITLSPTSRENCDTPPPLAAPAFTLSASSGSVTTGSAITSYTISSTGGAIVSYAISPAISNGTLSFSTSTGLLSGTPNTAAGAIVYTITANNATAPDATATYTLTINAPVEEYVPSPPVPYLKNLTPPTLLIVGGNRSKLYCLAGMYQFGYTIDGVVQGNPAARIKPSSYIFNLLLNGISQSLLTITTKDPIPFWDATGLPSGSIASCSVTVTVNNLTNTAASTDLSDENKSKLSVASSMLNQAITDADNAFLLAQSTNSKIYNEALVNNRLDWRLVVPKACETFVSENNRILKLIGTINTTNWLSLMNRARDTFYLAVKNAPRDWESANSLSLVAKDAANQSAFDAKNLAIAKANASYGTFIESIGYGVLIP